VKLSHSSLLTDEFKKNEEVDTAITTSKNTHFMSELVRSASKAYLLKGLSIEIFSKKRRILEKFVVISN